MTGWSVRPPRYTQVSIGEPTKLGWPHKRGRPTEGGVWSASARTLSHLHGRLTLIVESFTQIPLSMSKHADRAAASGNPAAIPPPEEGSINRRDGHRKTNQHGTKGRSRP